MHTWFTHVTFVARLGKVVRMVSAAVRARKMRVGLAVLLLVLLVASTSTVLVIRGRAAGATPLHVWLHYDYLVGAPDGHSDAPDPAAIQLVVDAFARHDIKLEIDNHHNEIPWKPYISLVGTCSGLDTLTLADVEAQYFHPTSNHDWDYALFGSRIKSSLSTPQCSGSFIESGEAWAYYNGFVIDQDYLTRVWRGNIYAVGGIFMHELGHNLGLRHGGDGDTNYKPNYVSVMNYLFPLGIPYAATPGSTTAVGSRLDYSDGALPTLDEAHLNEPLGIHGGPTDTDITFFWFAFPPPNDQPRHAFGPASGPIDWDQDGAATDTDVKMDVNADGEFTLLHGFDDWAYIRGVLLGQIAPGPKTIATEGEAEEPVVTGISPTSGPASGGTTVTITGTHLGKATQVLFGSVSANFTAVDDKTITAVAPMAPAADLGGYTTDVTVVSGDNPSPSVVADQFTYTSVLPVITSITPSSGEIGTTITITGSHFTGTTFVGAGALDPQVSANFTVINDSTISAVIPPWYAPDTPHTFDVRVQTLYGLTPLSANDQFTQLPTPPPTISGVTPTNGPVGTLITITGTRLTIPGTTSSVGFTGCYGTLLAPATANPDGSISTTVPACAQTGPLTVWRWIYGYTTEQSFTVTIPTPAPLPTLSGFTPSSGPAGTLVTLTGTNLKVPGSPEVLFAGCGAATTVPATPQADGTLTVNVPACAQTGLLTVFTAGGSATSAQSFTVT